MIAPAARPLRIAIAGASSLLGREIAELMSHSTLPTHELRLLDDAALAGTLTEAGGEPAVIHLFTTGSFEGAHMVFLGLKASNIHVERGDKVSISASGMVTMTPWGNRAFSSPDGAANFGWYIEGQIPGGALVAQVGETGPIFKVGSKHTFTSDRAGTLQFGIALAGNHANQTFPGQYNVKVVVRRK